MIYRCAYTLPLIGVPLGRAATVAEPLASEIRVNNPVPAANVVFESVNTPLLSIENLPVPLPSKVFAPDPLRVKLLNTTGLEALVLLIAWAPDNAKFTVPPEDVKVPWLVLLKVAAEIFSVPPVCVITLVLVNVPLLLKLLVPVPKSKMPAFEKLPVMVLLPLPKFSVAPDAFVIVLLKVPAPPANMSEPGELLATAPVTVMGAVPDNVMVPVLVNAPPTDNVPDTSIVPVDELVKAPAAPLPVKCKVLPEGTLISPALVMGTAEFNVDDAVNKVDALAPKLRAPLPDPLAIVAVELAFVIIPLVMVKVVALAPPTVKVGVLLVPKMMVPTDWEAEIVGWLADPL